MLIPSFLKVMFMLTTTNIGLLRLLQLSNSTLPVGAYAFSQGLESAVDRGWVNSSSDLHEWIKSQLRSSMTEVDVPLLIRQIKSVSDNDLDKIRYWNHYLLACRETKELRLGELEMGKAIARLLSALDVSFLMSKDSDFTFLTGFAVASVAWKLDSKVAATGYIWAWLESQVSAATKIFPLGQNCAQGLLSQLITHVPAVIEKAHGIKDREIGCSLPALAIASSWHEDQYSRLFRS